MELATASVSPSFLLFSSLAGIVVGWLLPEMTGFFRRKRERREARGQADAERTFGVLKAWQIVLDSSAMLAIQKDHASQGHTTGEAQVPQFSDDLNAAQRSLRELGIEVEVLGPGWLRPKVLQIVGMLSDLNRDLVELDKPFTIQKGTAFRDKVDEMLADRQALVDLASSHLSDE